MKISEFVKEINGALSAPEFHKEVGKVLEKEISSLVLDEWGDSPVNERGYVRKMLYTSPNFSVLQIKWTPGSSTPVHGHNAWGHVGVIQGPVGVESYNRSDKCIQSEGSVFAPRGIISSVDPDPEGIHRIYNPGTEDVATLHIYGMDLSEDPVAINVVYENVKY